MAEERLDVAFSGRFLRASWRRVAAGAFGEEAEGPTVGLGIGSSVLHSTALSRMVGPKEQPPFGVCLGFFLFLYSDHLVSRAFLHTFYQLKYFSYSPFSIKSIFTDFFS